MIPRHEPSPTSSSHPSPPYHSSPSRLGKRRRPSPPPSPPPTGAEPGLVSKGSRSNSSPTPPAARTRYSSPVPRTRSTAQYPTSPSPATLSESDEGGSTPLPSAGGGWTYHLEVIQQPIRARACGFGDKDRRPLSPPPIIRLWVRTATGETVDPNHINVHFLILTVDLWSADRTSQRNVVMHPAASGGKEEFSSYPSGMEHHFSVASSSRPSTSYSRPDTGYSTSSWAELGPSSRAPAYPTATSPLPSPYSRMTASDGYFPQSAPRSPISAPWAPLTPPQPPTPVRRSSYTGQQAYHVQEPQRPVTAPAPSDPTHSSHHPPPRMLPFPLPSLASITERFEGWSKPQTPTTLPAMRYRSQEETSYRPSTGTTESRAPTDYSFGRPTSSGTSTTWYSDQQYKDSTHMEQRPTTAGSGWGRPSSSSSSVRFVDRPGSSHGYASEYPVPGMDMRQRAESPVDSGSYSRVLVGSLCTICRRLKDPDGNFGLFFFAHDLGVRTEGTFTLKFSLSNLAAMLVGVPPAGQKTHVLAEVFSTPFTVFSAKKFPGVIPTTDLTRLFAGQNVRLPTRQKRAIEGGDDSIEGEDDD
ncbi:hypothetical protein M231_01425 [Tremella mesenterica]|uniref:Velvet domain-containing protein n=1 Tax=Tremella mesenterica TaxID=5217 RepID=A0A4Q1BTD7_TREME|nr:hypothetical protein M231_01425 [Tremella mesenterica]